MNITFVPLIYLSTKKTFHFESKSVSFLLTNILQVSTKSKRLCKHFPNQSWFIFQKHNRINRITHLYKKKNHTKNRGSTNRQIRNSKIEIFILFSSRFLLSKLQLFLICIWFAYIRYYTSSLFLPKQFLCYCRCGFIAHSRMDHFIVFLCFLFYYKLLLLFTQIFFI